MPFGGVPSLAIAFKPNDLRAAMVVTNAFRRSAFTGRLHLRMHQANSNEVTNAFRRSAFTGRSQMAGQQVCSLGVTNAFRRSAFTGLGLPRKKPFTD